MTYTAEISFRLPRSHSADERDAINDRVANAITDSDVATIFHSERKVSFDVWWDGKPSDVATFVERIQAALPEGSQFASVKVEKDDDAE